MPSLYVPGSSGGGGPYPIVTPPALAGWNQQNMAAATATPTDVSGGVALALPSVATAQLALLTRALGATPWTLIAGFASHVPFYAESGFGLFIYDSVSGKIETLWQDYSTVENYKVGRWTNLTTFSIDVVTLNQTFDGIWYEKMTDDGVNRTWFLSPDGIVWTQVATYASAAFMTPNQAGFGGFNKASGKPISGRCFSWSGA